MLGKNEVKFSKPSIHWSTDGGVTSPWPPEFDHERITHNLLEHIILSFLILRQESPTPLSLLEISKWYFLDKSFPDFIFELISYLSDSYTVLFIHVFWAIIVPP